MGWMTALVLAGALVVLLGLYALFSKLAATLETRRIVRHGRQIQWEQALHRLRLGDGYLVENLSSFPGKLWWVSEPSVNTEGDLFCAMKEDGLLIIDPPDDYRQRLEREGIPDRVKTVAVESFVD